MKHKILVVSGISGTGKSSVIAEVLKKYPGELIKSVTTRASRGENDYYYHVKTEEFESYPGGFLEKNVYNGNCYGTPRTEVFRVFEEGKLVVFDIDVNGFKQIAEKAEELQAEVTSVFLMAEPEDIYRRLLNRGTESAEKIIARMETGLSEIKELGLYDTVIWNDVLEETAEKLLAVINGHQPKTEVSCESERIRNFEAKMKSLLENLKVN